MKHRVVRYLAVAMAAAAFFPLHAHAQWAGTTSTANLAISARADEQAAPKMVPTPDGGFYIMWLDNGPGTGTGYNYWLQRVDACGVGQWGTASDPGIEINAGLNPGIFDVGQVSVDAAGNAYVAVPTDGNGTLTGSIGGLGTLDIRVHKITPSGQKLWGADGVLMGPTRNAATTGFTLYTPRICPLPGGGAAVAYMTSYASTSSASATSSIEVMTLDANGVPVWATAKLLRDLPLATTSASRRPWQLCDLKPGNNDGTFIVVWRRSAGNNAVTSNNIMYAQKYDAAGTPQWDSGAATDPGEGSGKAIAVSPGSTGTGVGLGATLWPAYSDNAGGVICAWADGGGARRAFIQHVLSNGTLKWNNGATPAVSAPVSDVDLADPTYPVVPATGARAAFNGMGVAYDATSGAYFLATAEGQVTPSQGNYSAIVQKFDATGARVWGLQTTNAGDPYFSQRGVTFVANESPGFVNQPSFAQVVPLPDGGCIAASMDLSGSGFTRVIKASRIDAAGNIVWSVQPNSDNSTDKSRFTMIGSTLGFAVGAFAAGPSASADLYAQNINPDGSFGLTGPVVASQPTNIRACGNNSATLSVSACGPGTVQYQWRRGGMPIDGATGATLVLAPAKSTDAGSYDCLISTDPATSTATSNPATLVVCVADFDCVGGVTIDDIFAFLNAWFAGDPRCDVDHAGGVAIDDIFAYLNLWFAGGC